MTTAWDPQDWQTARLHVGASFINNWWIKMGVCYGYAQTPGCQTTKQKTDHLLAQLTDRLVFQSHGPRILCGDFNQSPDALRQFSVWRNHGFIEIQELALQRWGRPVMPTCQSKSVTDHVWVSRELWPYITSVHTDESLFTDHAALWACLAPMPPPTPIPVWRKPLPLPWDELKDEDIPSSEFVASEGSTTQQVQQIFAAVEEVVSNAVHAKGGKVLPQQLGRCCTERPKEKQFIVPPLKRSRPGKVNISYLGENWQHVKWCHQLRRLQSSVQLRSSPKQGAHMLQHAQELWHSIRRAPGFPKGFLTTWQQITPKSEGAPDKLPVIAPPLDLAQAVFTTFRQEFQSLEKLLNKTRSQKAKERRQENSHVVFKDVAKPRAAPIQSLAEETVAQVIDISDDGLRVTCDKDWASHDQPLFGPQGTLDFIAREGPQLSFAKATALEIGDQVRQEVFIGDVRQVFRAFTTYWDKMWLKHEDTPLERWEPFIHHLRQQDGAPGVMPLSPISVEEWKQTVRRKKSTTATGPDGVSRCDLERMPHSHVVALVTLINRIESEGLPWPKVVLQGHVSSLEKHGHAMGPADYRPITVLGLIYRVYASLRAKQALQWLDSFAEPHIIGNRPHRSTKHIWWSLSEHIEYCHHFDLDLAGLTTDVRKAFNCLPRQAVIACAHHYGLPPVLINCWHRAVSHIERFFIVEGACSDPCFATCGYPEGDPMSVVSMFLVNQAMHKWVMSQSKPCQPVSYVDNWELVSSQPESIIPAEQALASFVDEIDISLDTAKTYVWALSASGRKLLRRQFGDVKYDCKDLGGHVVYCKRATMHTISSRIKASQDIWTWLARSVAPDKQKMHVLSSVAWPRCLHAISSVRIGKEHVNKLRCAAMQALGWDKKGANSSLQFGISPFPKSDPGLYILIETVADFRAHFSPEFSFPVLDRLAWEPPKHTPQGPCSALLHQLHNICWHWEGNGYIRDHDAIQWSIVEAPFQWIVYKLIQGWACRVGGLLQTRPGFEGLAQVDRTTTFANWESWTLERKGILRAAMNGTFYTNDALVHTGHVESKSCPYCGELDGKWHRLWECPHFKAERAAIPAEVQMQIQEEPPCFHTHGWVVERPSSGLFRQVLHTIPDTSRDIEWNTLPTGTLHLFTDGACLSPTVPGARLASWAVCVADATLEHFPVISQGGVTGGCHTALRGELTAAFSAIFAAVSVHRDFTLWLDNQAVYNYLVKCRQGQHKRRTARQSNHDLWNALGAIAVTARDRGLFLGLVKVQSHAEQPPDDTSVDAWAIRGNHAVDKAAAGALLALPSKVLRLWERVQDDLAGQARLRDHVQLLMIRIGERALTEALPLHVIPQCPPVDRANKVETRVSFQPFPAQLVPFPPQVGSLVQPFFTWLQTIIHAEDAIPCWITGYHLLAHFQMVNKIYGYQFSAPQKVWRRVDDLQTCGGPSFLKCTRWFMAFLKHIATHYGFDWVVESTQPSGDLFSCWARCIRMPCPSSVMSGIETILGLHAGRIRSVKSHFGGVSDFVAFDLP